MGWFVDERCGHQLNARSLVYANLYFVPPWLLFPPVYFSRFSSSKCCKCTGKVTYTSCLLSSCLPRSTFIVFLSRVLTDGCRRTCARRLLGTPRLYKQHQELPRCPVLIDVAPQSGLSARNHRPKPGDRTNLFYRLHVVVFRSTDKWNILFIYFFFFTKLYKRDKDWTGFSNQPFRPIRIFFKRIDNFSIGTYTTILTLKFNLISTNASLLFRLDSNSITFSEFIFKK